MARGGVLRHAHHRHRPAHRRCPGIGLAHREHGRQRPGRQQWVTLRDARGTEFRYGSAVPSALGLGGRASACFYAVRIGVTVEKGQAIAVGFGFGDGLRVGFGLRVAIFIADGGPHHPANPVADPHPYAHAYTVAFVNLAVGFPSARPPPTSITQQTRPYPADSTTVRGMDDRETVAAIVAGDLAGLAEAYDEYAESLYGYCHWMLHEPADAGDAVQDTYLIAAGRLGGLQDPRKLRPWLYAVARNECHRRLRADEVGLDDAADVADPSADVSHADRAELRRLVRAALSGLNPGEREVLELELRHDLHGADLAAVLGVSRNQAHALAAQARGQLEKALGALLVSRGGRRACPELDMLLADWDGRLTGPVRKRISRHVDQCEVCDDRRRGALRPAALFGMTPLAALPPELRDEVLNLCADDSYPTMAYRQEVTLRAGPFGPNGFPEPIRQPRQRILIVSRVAAAVGILIAIASTGIIAALALSGSHPPHSSDAARAGGSATASAAGTADPTAGDGTPVSFPPTLNQPTTADQPAAATSAAQPSPSPSASPSKAKPAPTATTSAPAAPTPTPTSLPTPRPTPTSSSTATPTPTPRPTQSLLP